MSVEKIPENGRRIDVNKFRWLINDVIAYSRIWDSDEWCCSWCRFPWENSAEDNLKDHQEQSPTCAYVVAREFEKEFNL